MLIENQRYLENIEREKHYSQCRALYDSITKHSRRAYVFDCIYSGLMLFFIVIFSFYEINKINLGLLSFAWSSTYFALSTYLRLTSSRYHYTILAYPLFAVLYATFGNCYAPSSITSFWGIPVEAGISIAFALVASAVLITAFHLPCICTTGKHEALKKEEGYPLFTTKTVKASAYESSAYVPPENRKTEMDEI